MFLTFEDVYCLCEFVWLRATFLKFRAQNVAVTQTSSESWQCTGEHINSSWGVSYFRRHAASIARNSFSILHQLSTRDEDDGFKHATVHLPGTLPKEMFIQLHEAIVDTFLKERQQLAPVDPFWNVSH